MFQKLRQKWKVGPLQLGLILTVFAVGGSLTGLAGRRLLALINIDQPVAWCLIYLIVVTLVWPLMVLTVSIPLGQFSFFRNYLKKLIMALAGRKATNK